MISLTNDCSAQWEIPIYLVRAVCEMRLASYESKLVSQSFSNDFLCVLTHITLKLLFYIMHNDIMHDCSAIGDVLVCFRAGSEIRFVSFGSKHALESVADWLWYSGKLQDNVPHSQYRYCLRPLLWTVLF